MSDGPASGATGNVCAALLRLVTVRARVAGALAAVTMPKSSSDALRASGSDVAFVAGRVTVADARPDAESVTLPGASEILTDGTSDTLELAETAESATLVAVTVTVCAEGMEAGAV